MTPYLGQITLVGFNFAPVGWAICDGSLLPISEFSALFTLVGTTYGGDGQETFALPDLRGRVPIHQGAGFVQGQVGGSESVTVAVNQLPSHSHLLQASSAAGSSAAPAGNVLATTAIDVYSAQAGDTVLSSTTTATGGSQPHENRMPFLAATYIIALEGIFPSQN